MGERKLKSNAGYLEAAVGRLRRIETSFCLQPYHLVSDRDELDGLDGGATRLEIAIFRVVIRAPFN